MAAVAVTAGVTGTANAAPAADPVPYTVVSGSTNGVIKGAPIAPQKAAAQLRADAEKRGAFYESPVSAMPGALSGNGSSQAEMPTTPAGAWLDDCLASTEATTPKGRVYNRFNWCQEVRYRADFTEIVDGEPVHRGTSYLTFQGAGIGYNDKRATRVFWRVKPGSVSYNWGLFDYFAPRRMPLAVGVECSQSSVSCTVSKGAATMEWQQWANFGWTHWDVFGHESGATSLNNPDKVSFTGWFFTLDSSNAKYKAPRTQTQPIGIRCDSATYFNIGTKRYPYACIYSGALPFLTYNAADGSNGQVARHIRDAQSAPDTTYPKEWHPKKIPGKWAANAGERAEPLHRVDRDGQFGRSNENWKRSACGQNTTVGNPWAPYYTPTTGLPATTAPDQQCDEYPFGSTWEGAADPDHDFSVRWVDKSHNASAGYRLLEFYVNDRILRYEPNFLGGTPSGPSADPFWVNIN
ncbi:deoxyribonuclease NucA/NucB [Thermomonospora umbrina]|uniref:Deoxyribonuclease NucA/NucB n=1 Tax=Thermomonospora umbrina TaxID=111806 RepID=A0A3D9T5V5_9ACTN|nr:deoxyribonuclease NucA/NucB [Thermomonospora umbrina]